MQIVHNHIHNKKAMYTAINHQIIDQYSGRFTIEEVRRVLVMDANTKKLTEKG